MAEQINTNRTPETLKAIANGEVKPAIPAKKSTKTVPKATKAPEAPKGNGKTAKAPAVPVAPAKVTKAAPVEDKKTSSKLKVPVVKVTQLANFLKAFPAMKPLVDAMKKEGMDLVRCELQFEKGGKRVTHWLKNWGTEAEGYTDLAPVAPAKKSKK